MPISEFPEWPEETERKEKETQLGDEASPRLHGTLTIELHRILQRANPGRETASDLERDLKEKFKDDVTVRISEGAGSHLLLADELEGKADQLLVRMDQQRARRIIATLEEMIARRELQGDYWPEGRLNLGIAYAYLGEYKDARRWLDHAVNMLRHPYPSYAA